jgi:hypothetical protein
MDSTQKDFKIFPKFRHNLLTKYKENPEITYLTFSKGTYEVTTRDANKFIKIRSFCTGHNNLSDIAKKSKIPQSNIKSIIDSFIEIDMLHQPFKPLENLTTKEIVNTVISL